jgi:nicotinamidase/pyrazinamidase
MARKIQLITIDPQNDFCIKTGPGGEAGALVVPGADADMNRLGAFITKHKNKFDKIHCTLDSHQVIHIAHGIFWVNTKGEHPQPFTVITNDDVKNGVWRAMHPQWQARAAKYVETLTTNGRYPLVIWPVHCVIGSWGHSIVPGVQKALQDWENDFNVVNYVAKGSNRFTEHYSGVQADVMDDEDPSTKLNTDLIDALVEADEILITGEALSHCVANTITDIANRFGDDNVKKFTLLEDTASNVPGFEKLGRDFVTNMVKKGMKVTTTKDW